MFNLDDYEPVEARLARFIADYPEFRIDTELEKIGNDGFIVKAYLYRTAEAALAFATGYAEEKVSDRGVNSTSALENCETSAIGRALANAGYAAKGKRASQSEMDKVNRTTHKLKLAAVPDRADTARPAPKPAPISNNSTDYWATPFGDGSQTQERPAPVIVEKTLHVVADDIYTPPAVPECQHGSMRWRDGEKNGRQWGGYFCGQTSQTSGFAQACPTLWYVIGSSGTWRPQEAK